jgi:DNA transformation protein and related proteins
MIDSSTFVENVLEQFAAVEGIATRRMFGGMGIYRYGVMFAIIADDRLYFKVDETNKPDYQSAGSVPFIYDKHDKNGNEKLVTMSYWEIPPHVLEDKDLIFRWMVKAHEAGIRAKTKKVK